jgi:hypothetical protein
MIDPDDFDRTPVQPWEMALLTGPAEGQCECGAYWCGTDHGADAGARSFDPLS